MTYSEARAYAQQMRKNPTPAEQLFWEQVRNKRFLGLKFNRQFVIEYLDSNEITHYYIPDFHCYAKKLLVEIDGKIHLLQVAEDSLREERLRLLGFQVIRFSNEEVLRDLAGVMSRLAGLVGKI